MIHRECVSDPATDARVRCEVTLAAHWRIGVPMLRASHCASMKQEMKLSIVFVANIRPQGMFAEARVRKIAARM
jgi:hypothetical protein